VLPLAFHLVKNEQQGIATGHQNDGAGTLYTAVAHTNHGDIPGKAKGNTCWYPYAGKEEYTQDFSYVACPTFKLSKACNGVIPRHSIATGHQNDAAGTLYAGVAHTNHGDIPGKANANTCWYPYGGKEELTQNYSYVISAFDLVKGNQPNNAVACGFQNDGAGTLYAAVAHHTTHGNIPGKAKDNTCWYAYGGNEVYTNDFSWVVSSGWKLEKNAGYTPTDAFPVGHQNDGAGTLYAAVAHHTNHGNIPGKAKDNTCWYPYAGKEVYTNDFSWIV